MRQDFTQLDLLFYVHKSKMFFTNATIIPRKFVPLCQELKKHHKNKAKKINDSLLTAN